MFGQKTAFDYSVGIIALFLLVHQIYLLTHYWPILPEKIPTHFDFLGRPDSYGSKKILVLLPIVSVVLFILLTLVAMRPDRMNLSVKITPENQEFIYGKAVQLMHLLRLVLTFIFWYLMNGTIRVALGKQTQLDSWVLWVFIAMPLASTIWFFISISGRK